MYIHVHRYKAVGVENRIQNGSLKNFDAIPGRQDTFLFHKHAVCVQPLSCSTCTEDTSPDHSGRSLKLTTFVDYKG